MNELCRIGQKVMRANTMGELVKCRNWQNCRAKKSCRRSTDPITYGQKFESWEFKTVEDWIGRKVPKCDGFVDNGRFPNNED